MSIGLNPDSLRRSICRESFWEFVQGFWEEVVPEKPVWNWHIPFLCDELQKMAERVFLGLPKEYDLIINIPPGTTKSTICSIMFPAWVWTRMATARLICGSYAYALSMDLSRKCRMVVQSDQYQRLFPKIGLREDQNTKGHFATSEGGGRISVGSGGSITGFHGHFILVDDPMDPNAALSEADLLSTNNWMRETLPTRKVDKEIAPTILIMQRLHQNDPTGEWLERSGGDTGLRLIKLPAEADDGVFPAELGERYREGLLDCVRLKRTVLNEAKRTLGEYGYAGQFSQSPIPRGGGDFKVDKITVEISPPIHFINRVRYWDKAGTKGGGAYTAGILMGKDRQGRFWILDMKRGQWDATEREQIIRQTAEVDGTAVMVGLEQEPGSGGKESAQYTLRNLAGFRVKVDRPVGDKRTRAYPFSDQVNGGNVLLKKGEWNTDYLNELMYFPRGKYKDQVDASSGAFALLTQTKRRVGGL